MRMLSATSVTPARRYLPVRSIGEEGLTCPYMIAMEVSDHGIVKIRNPRWKVPGNIARDPVARRARCVRVWIDFRRPIPRRTSIYQHRRPIRQNKQCGISSSGGYLVNVERSQGPWSEGRPRLCNCRSDSIIECCGCRILSISRIYKG